MNVFYDFFLQFPRVERSCCCRELKLIECEMYATMRRTQSVDESAAVLLNGPLCRTVE